MKRQVGGASAAAALLVASVWATLGVTSSVTSRDPAPSQLDTVYIEGLQAHFTLSKIPVVI